MYAPLTEKKIRALCRFLAGEEEPFVFLESTRMSSENHRSLLFRQPVSMLRLLPGETPDRFFGRMTKFLEQGYYLAGWFSYELGYLLESVLAGGAEFDPQMVLAELGVFREPHIYDHRLGDFTGAGPWPEGETGEEDEGYGLANLRPSQTQREYQQQVARIRAYIAAGDTYQVNYTLKLLFDFQGEPGAFYRALRRNQSVSYGGFLQMGQRRLLSFSPELFWRKAGSTCLVRPMKGTVRRGRTMAEDRKLQEFLRTDLKNRSENVMIVDLLRNDLGRLSRPGRVFTRSLFDVEAYESLFQMTSTIEGELRPEVSLPELFKALFPCGSVTGAPKIRTMEIIRELESAPRGAYTGAIGYFGPNGESVLSVPIRTVLLEKDRGEMGIGSGIVYDSVPEEEWDECLVKGRFLTEPLPPFLLLETMLWLPEEGYWLLELHLNRLNSSAAYFGYWLDLPAVRQTLAARARTFDQEKPYRVRLTLAKDGTFDLEAVPVGPACCSFSVADRAEELPRITLAAPRIPSASPFVYHKTTRRELFDQERQQAVAAGFYEVLFRNEREEITEGSITNIFLRQGTRLFTPPVECGLLNGVFRQHLLQSGKVEERVMREEDLREAEAIYLGNSVRGLVRVRL